MENNKRIVVLGGGESGAGAAVLAKVKGFDVFLSDRGKIAAEHAELLKKWDIPFEEAGSEADGGVHVRSCTPLPPPTRSRTGT